MSRPQLLTRPSSRLTVNKTIVLVTSGNAGIGFQIVKSLALSHPDFQVLMGCRETSKGEAAVSSMGAPSNVNPIQLDITDDRSVELCYKTIEQMFGRLDVLVNNVETGGEEVAVSDQNPAGAHPHSRQVWEHIINTNLTSTGYFTQVLLPLLENSTLPRVVFLSSKLSSIPGTLRNNGRGGDSDRDRARDHRQTPRAAFQASKAGVNMLVAYYATLYPRIKVNALCPDPKVTGVTGPPSTSTKPIDDIDADAEVALNGAVARVVQLVNEGQGGVTGTFSESFTPW